MNDARYLQFPLFMVRELFVEKEKTINSIIWYGVYHFSKKQEYTISQVATELIYGYRRSILTEEIKSMTNLYVTIGSIVLEERYSKFNGEGKVDLELTVEKLVELFQYDEPFKNLAIEFYQIKQAHDFLGVECKVESLETCLTFGKQVEESIPEKEPFPMIRVSLLFEFRDNPKSEFDIAQLAAYMAIRSILGTKAFCKTNKLMILSRMFGYKGIDLMPVDMDSSLKVIYDKYLIRYHFDFLKDQLELAWFVITYSSYSRGLFITMKEKMTLDALIDIVQANKRKNRLIKLKTLKQEATAKALKKLNNRTES